MNKVKYKIIAIVVFLTVISCGKDKKEPVQKKSENTENHIEGSVDLNHTNSTSNVVFADETMNSIYSQYLLIKGALVNSNAKTVQKEARKLETVIDESLDAKQLKATIKLIALTKEIKKQRDFFVTLTAEIEKLISNATITSGEIYKQFCPMAFEGDGGYWLSDSKEVRNPYFGNSMLKCGSVKETLQ
ncbi:hypothetical protein AB832_00320 [Flavobacteriaceae bacterium (ex Bugula neritina AB1)]|nr:hypothetical protein AB832_00320 [Flavobacteriaceae bacterium (ex Bugula neritina AB1)]